MKANKRPDKCPKCKAPNFSYDTRAPRWHFIVIQKVADGWQCSKCNGNALKRLDSIKQMTLNFN
jgi:predicted nucleic-acid-binding Zn-ribbon protein